MESFYKKDGIVDSLYDSSNKTIIIYWKSLMNDKVIEEACLAQIEKAKAGAKVMILDTSIATGIPTQKRQKWFGEVIFPKFNELGLKAIITIIPKESVLTKFSSQQWVKTGDPFGFDMLEVSDMDVAKEQAKKYL